MVISHKYRYLFVELPRTGSTAISKELCEHYDGSRILYKHATYEAFLRSAAPEEKKYFVFSGIRNPMDDVVSLYFKYLTDHKRRFSNANKRAKRKGLVGYLTTRRFNFVQAHEFDFSTYFTRYYRMPYDNWSSLSHGRFNFVIRFEHLQDDFAQALKLIGVEPVRPLPAVNPTSGRKRDFMSYYTPDIAPYARRVFGPYMRRWNYSFPAEWGDGAVSRRSEWEYRFFGVFRRFYWRYLRPALHAPADDREEKDDADVA